MTFGNSAKGRRGVAPPPLPMYEPVVLKHVPTMVRRRYEKFDADKLEPNSTVDHDNEDLATHDSDIECVTDEEMEAYCALDMDSSVEDGTQDIAHENSSNQQGLAPEDSKKDGDQSDLEHSSSTEVDNEEHDPAYGCSGDENGQCKSEDNNLQGTHDVSRAVDAVVADQDGKCSVTVDHCIREDLPSHQDEHFSCEVDTGVADECQQSEIECTMSYEASTGAWNEGSSNGSIQPTDFQTGELRNEHDGVSEASDAGQMDSDIENEGFPTGDGKGEGYEARDVKGSFDTCVKDEPQEVGERISEKQGLPSEVGHSDTDCDEAEDKNLTFSIDSQEAIKRHTNLNNQHDEEQISCTEDSGSDNFRSRSLDFDLETEDDKAEDKDLACDAAVHESMLTCNVDATVKDRVQIEVQNCNDGEKDYGAAKYNKNSEEEEAYELCCPICKQCITKTIIFRCREKDEHCRTTCFSWFIAQFCCIRS